MTFAALMTASSPAFLTVFGESIPVKLHGILDFTLLAIYNAGGEEMMLANGEVVVTRPTIYLTTTDADRITKEHTLTTTDGDMKTFGGIVPDGTGNGTWTLVKRG